ncbi:MAG TPA: metallophosphoesterase [Kofleriaceae bacterium]|nr:metallophosphoesterase [Kofleriaceae bacterium]
MRRHVVIGDVHGCHQELLALLDRIGPSQDDVLVSVGDLVDRGPEPAEVIRFFRDRPGSVVLTGNHERKHVRGVRSYAQEMTRLQLGAGYAEAVEWMATLPYYLELDDAIVVHAGLVPGVSLAEQREDVLCGSTAGEHELERQLAGRRWHEVWEGPKPVVFGHHVVDQPLVRPGLIYGIDTGACHGGRLTALTLPDRRLHSVAAREDHWARMKRSWQADVLADRPWRELSWSELDRELARFDGRRRTSDEPRTAAYVDALRAWRASLDARLVEVVDAIRREAERIDAEDGPAGRTERARAHPLARYLFQSTAGRLDPAALRRQCHTPAMLAELGRALGLAPLEPPAPPPPLRDD